MLLRMYAILRHFAVECFQLSAANPNQNDRTNQ